MGYDPFELSSGLVEGDVKITDALFAFDPEYQNGQALRLELTVAHEDGEQVVKLGCGKDWTSRDKGKTAEHENKPDVNFNKNSGVGMFFGGTKGISASLPGLVGLMRDDASVEKSVMAKVKDVPLGPRDRDFWIGLQAHLSRLDVDFGGEIGVIDRVVIDGLTGWEGSTAAKAAVAKRVSKKATAKASVSGPDSGDIDPAIRTKLDQIADDSENPDEFAERAFAEVAEATSDETVKAAVLDQAPGSIWDDAVERYNAKN